MTYCLGWKTNNCVILAADAAITKNEGKLIFPITSFGEKAVVRVDGKSVNECALKVYQFNNCILTYAGDVSKARELIDLLYHELTQGIRPRDALNSALFHTILPTDYSKLCIIFTFKEDGEFILLSVKDGILQEHENIVQFGSMIGHIKLMTLDFVSRFDKDDYGPEKKMAGLLTILQGYGQMNDFMSTGVGGVYAAACLDDKGTRWQPDILHIFGADVAREMVGVAVRKNCLVANSSIRKRRALSLLNTPPPLPLLQRIYAENECFDRFFSGRFDYVSFFQKESTSLVLIEMRHKLKHFLIFLDPPYLRDDDNFEAHFHPLLLKKLHEGILDSEGKITPNIHIFPYSKPNTNSPLIRAWSLRKQS